MKNIAIFGGSFDPPTRAHVNIMEACLARPEFDEVWVMPSGWRQDKPYMTSDAGRLAMLGTVQAELFVDDGRLKVVDFEQRLAQPTETYKTAQSLQAAYPDDSFWFVFGADSYHDMPNWRHGQQLRRSLGLLLTSRSDLTLPAESATIKHLRVEGNNQTVSSTAIREACRSGLDVEKFTTQAVANYIYKQQLYGYGHSTTRMIV